MVWSNVRAAKGSKRGERNSRAKLTASEVVDMRYLYDVEGWSVPRIGRKYTKISDSNIRSVVQRKIWTHIKP